MCGGALRPNDLGLLRNAQPALSITRRAPFICSSQSLIWDYIDAARAWQLQLGERKRLTRRFLSAPANFHPHLIYSGRR